MYTKSLTPLLLTKLGNLLIIYGRLWIKKHKVIIDMINNFLVFWPAYCTHIRVFSSITLSQPTLQIEIAIVRIEKYITL